MSTWSRADGRAVDEMRTVTIRRHFLDEGEGSVLVSFGKTTVLCVASFTQGVPRWRRDSGLGWVTGEYSMLPRATNERMQRESVRGKLGGRTHEISRLVGRALRAAVDMEALGENTIVLDCDVLQADGGTRTASVTGAFVALADAVNWAVEKKIMRPRVGSPILNDTISAVSVGIIDGHPVLDLPYEEDSRADTDMNVVAMGSGKFVEIQGTAEHAPFSRDELGTLLDLATTGTNHLAALQREALFGQDAIHSGIVGGQA
ncbi:ribonuclease PH [Changpingibacter yushuensis]|uniref:ribonuclease PH n=1 Tax=Changpingibacter yushuensis TaxID=2758440 RepID=UPI00165DC6B1|nr:ribonuclease PH [Changpingibacter yushuensis]